MTQTAAILTDPKGMTLYTYDPDKQGASTCYGECAVAWPPYMVPADATVSAPWGTTTRTDGSKQWTYNGWPLYYFYTDKKPGDVTGDNDGGVWHVIKLST